MVATKTPPQMAAIKVRLNRLRQDKPLSFMGVDLVLSMQPIHQRRSAIGEQYSEGDAVGQATTSANNE